MIFGKRGEMTTENAGEIILAIACIVVLLGVAVVMFFPESDMIDKISEANFENLEKAIADADSKGFGEFAIRDDRDSDRDIYLVYFGDKTTCTYKSEKPEFIRLEKGNNLICVCSDEGGKTKCGYCLELDKPVVSSSGCFVIKEGFSFVLTDRGGDYVFT